MRTDTKYLDVSKNGWFSYIRRIPSSIKHMPEMQGYTTFFTRAFDTKDRVLAEIETKKLNKWFDGLKGKATKPKTTKEKIRKIKDELRIRDLLLEPMPEAEATKFATDLSKIANFEDQLSYGEVMFYEDPAKANELPEPIFPNLESKYTDRKVRRQAEIDSLTALLEDRYSDGKGGYLRENPYDEDVIKLKILQGKYADAPLEPTFGDAVEAYVEDYRQNKRTNENQRNHWIGQIRSIAKRVASGLQKGLDTPLSELDCDEIKQIAEHVWANASTRNTNMSGRMVPVITRWNELNPRQKLDPNPFAGIVGSRQLEEDKKPRRSATPEEFASFWSNLEGPDVHPEIRLIGMMMAYTGCPQGETAGMLRRDLKLQSNVPHLIIRNNNHRLLAKQRLERCIPLVGSILQHWRHYISEHFSGGNEAPLFPRFGQGQHQVSERAKQLRPLVKNLEGGEEIFSSYSLRHSFKDRYKAAGVPEEIGIYLFGHRSKGSSAVHASYGGYQNPEFFVEHMTAINNTQSSFGYREHFDD